MRSSDPLIYTGKGLRKGQVELIALGISLVLLLAVSYMYFNCCLKHVERPYVKPLQDSVSGCVGTNSTLQVELSNPTDKEVIFEIIPVKSAFFEEYVSRTNVTLAPRSNVTVGITILPKKGGLYYLVLPVLWKSGKELHVDYVRVPAMFEQCK